MAFDLYSVSLAPVVSERSSLHSWSALGVFEVSVVVMGDTFTKLAVTDDFGSLVPVTYPSDTPVYWPLH